MNADFPHHICNPHFQLWQEFIITFVFHQREWKISLNKNHFGPYDSHALAIKVAVDAAHAEGKKDNDAQDLAQAANDQWRTEWTYGIIRFLQYTALKMKAVWSLNRSTMDHKQPLSLNLVADLTLEQPVLESHHFIRLITGFFRWCDKHKYLLHGTNPTSRPSNQHGY